MVLPGDCCRQYRLDNIVFIVPMILSGHAPCYLPGIQLFNKIALSDVFMHCGHLQFQDGDWHQRNYIRTGLLTVPVKRPHDIPLSEVEIDWDQWRPEKQLKRIEAAYSKEPFFDDLFPLISFPLKWHWNWLETLNNTLTEVLLDLLEISTEMVVNPEGLEGDAIDKIIQMCKSVGADEYLSNEGASHLHGGYIGPSETARMYHHGIRHRWQSFAHPDYGQEKEPNNGWFSIIDPLFRLGPERTRELVLNSGKIA